MLGKGGTFAALFFLAACATPAYIVDQGQHLQVVYRHNQTGTCYYHGPKTVRPTWTCTEWQDNLRTLDIPKEPSAEMLIIKENRQYISFFYYETYNCTHPSPPSWNGR